MNFAVTIAVFLAGGIKLKMVLPYLVFQILGSLAGAGLAYVSKLLSLYHYYFCLVIFLRTFFISTNILTLYHPTCKAR